MSNLGRRLREGLSRAEHKANNELIDLRAWYYCLPVEMRREYKEAIRLSAEAAEVLIRFDHHARLQFSYGQTDETGNTEYWFCGNQSPKVILQAIQMWDETAELFATEEKA